MKKIRILNPRNIEVLLYIYDNGGEVIGFRDLAMKLGKGYATLRDAMKDLEYAGLIEKEIVMKVVAKYTLTEKGKKIAKQIKEIVKMLEQT